MQIKSKSLEEFQETVLNVIVEQLNNNKDGFESSLIFSDYQKSYALYTYDNVQKCSSETDINELFESVENQMVEKYINGLFVDFKYLNFGYTEFLEWLEDFKSNLWFKSKGYILSYEILNDETINEEYVKLVVEKSRLILR